MGQFANTLFSMLLGWVQTAASWLWSLVTNTDVSAWLRWLLDNWLPLTLLLCIAGLALDFIIYLIRWQPYRVWGRFLRRWTGKGREAAEQEALELQARFQRKWIYADGTTTVEDIRQHDAEHEAEADHLELPIRPVRRVAKHAPPEQSYYQPVYPPQWQHTNDEQQGENQ